MSAPIPYTVNPNKSSGEINGRDKYKPGHLYVTVVYDYSGGPPQYGCLVWYGADDRLYDADGGDEFMGDFDDLIEQVGSFNPEYADS